ncbi:MAG: CBS domain-containing protein [Actinomycetota bacterium]|nr:CBS domain-containing protein [Actinomycetota bacterium]
MLYLSTMLGSSVIDAEGKRIGRLADLVVREEKGFPRVQEILIEARRGFKRWYFSASWLDIWEVDRKRLVLASGASKARMERNGIFLARDLLDRQIVDLDGYKVVRVSDVRLMEVGRDLRVMGVDVGFPAILRRLGFSRLAQSFQNIAPGFLGEKMIPWDFISLISPTESDIQLRIEHRRLHQLHPSDIADILEQLDEEKRAKMFALLEDPKAAEVLSEMVPQVRSALAENLTDARLSKFLEMLPSDEAADILGSLPREKAKSLIGLVKAEKASRITELLSYDPQSAGGLMTTEYVAIPKSMTAQQAIEYIREHVSSAETIYYVYVVDPEGHLSGVLSLRDLLRSSPEKAVQDIMIRDVIVANIFDDQEDVASKLSRYNLIALPVVDDDYVLKGIVTFDDAIDVINQEASEDVGELSGVFIEGGKIKSMFLNPTRAAVLVVSMAGGLIATAILGGLGNNFAALGSLFVLIPALLRSSHDVSFWPLAKRIHEMGEDEYLGGRKTPKESMEVVYVFLASIIVSLGAFLGSYLWFDSLLLSIAGAIGVFCGVLASGILAIILSILLARMKPRVILRAGTSVINLSALCVSILCFVFVTRFLVQLLG